ncbi:glycosyltransferase [Chloroflexota bacterium]
MKKVLFVSYAFPPQLSPESIQTSRYVKFLPQYGWEPYVICADEESILSEPIDKSMLSLLPPNIRMLKVRSFEPRILMMAIGKFLPVLFKLPDNKIGWRWSAYRKSLVALKEERFDLIHSWAMYLSSNIVGLKLKKKTGLPWVVHFSDPWVDSPYMHYGRLDAYINRKLERAVMERADAIVFVSEETRQLVMRKYPPEVRRRSAVIPHCYDPEIVAKTPPAKENPKLTFTYTGNFYYGMRTPMGLFQALHNILSKQPEIQDFINVQMVGTLHKDYQDAILRLGIEKVVSVVGAVPYLKSLECIQNASVLLLIDAPSKTPSIFLPLKLIEYIAFKKPILGITPVEGTSASLIKRLGGIVVSPEDIGGIEEGILTFYQKFKAGSLSDYAYSDDDIRSYSVVNATRTLAELFDSVC